MNIITQTLERVGFYTPFILFFLSLVVIKKRNVFFYYYVGGFFLNYLLNVLLKGFLKQPRPDSNVELLRVMENDGRYVHAQMYGMPSGHAQESFFSLVYIYFLKKDKNNKETRNFFLVFIGLCIVMLCQRVIMKKHSVLQITVGSVLGGFVGSFFYIMAEKQVKQEDTKKEEDNNFILEGFVN